LPGETGPIKVVTIVVGVCVVSARAAAAPQIRATLEQSTAIAFRTGSLLLEVAEAHLPTDLDTVSYPGKVPIRGSDHLHTARVPAQRARIAQPLLT
jgi:hypothetical protein